MYFGGCGGAIRHNNSNYVIIIIVVVTVVTAGIDIMFTVSSSNKTYGSWRVNPMTICSQTQTWNCISLLNSTNCIRETSYEMSAEHNTSDVFVPVVSLNFMFMNNFNKNNDNVRILL